MNNICTTFYHVPFSAASTSLLPNVEYDDDDDVWWTILAPLKSSQSLIMIAQWPACWSLLSSSQLAWIHCNNNNSSNTESADVALNTYSSSSGFLTTPPSFCLISYSFLKFSMSCWEIWTNKMPTIVENLEVVYNKHFEHVLVCCGSFLKIQKQSGSC